MLSVSATPHEFAFDLSKSAVVVVDMQGDFLLPGGFGDIQGRAHLDGVQATIAPTQRLLKTARDAGMTIIHTREGHLPDLSDCPTPKLTRQRHVATIGDPGHDGSRMLIRGEPFHDIVPSLAPLPGEIVIDKPGKGAFYNTDLHLKLVDRAISHLFVCGVTTECCVSSTAREASDRGFEVCIVSDCTDGYAPKFKDSTLDIFCSANGLFGYMTPSASVISSLKKHIELKSASSKKTWDGSLDIATLKSLYSLDVIKPETVIEEVYRRIGLPDADPAVWLHLVERSSALAYATELAAKYPNAATRPPLYGIPFSVKDSIDYEGVPTTGACPAYSFIPEKHATTVKLLLEAGAIFIGKVNLDQLATGLVGMRSPYGAPASVFSPLYVSGGSSSGSAVSVASRQVSFSLATDTAGSGRVPAAFNNIIGFKPTRGTLSADGVVPCCPALDCIALECLSPSEVRHVFNVLRQFDPTDPFAKVAIPSWAFAPRAVLQPGEKFTFAVPPKNSESWGYLCPEFEHLFLEAIKRLSSDSVGGKQATNVDYTVFEGAGRLLYEGSFVAERVASVQKWYDAHPAPSSPDEKDVLLPEIRSIYSAAAKNFTACDAWNDNARMAQFQRKSQAEFKKFQVLVVPTAPLHPTKAGYLADPIGLNHKLGKFTHYGNILDLCGVAIPAGFTPAGMPFGITILGQSFTEGLILEIADRFGKALGLPTGKTSLKSTAKVNGA